MKHLVAKIHPADNVLVALQDLPAGTPVTHDGVTVTTTEKIPAKHKLAMVALQPGDQVHMYGVLVGKAKSYIQEKFTSVLDASKSVDDVNKGLA